MFQSLLRCFYEISPSSKNNADWSLKRPVRAVINKHESLYFFPATAACAAARRAIGTRNGLQLTYANPSS